jgi:hypothetical protein
MELPRLIYDKNGHITEFIIVWSREDFEETAIENDLVLTDDQIDRAMDLCLNTHDCNYGISWDNVEACLEEALKEAD